MPAPIYAYGPWWANRSWDSQVCSSQQDAPGRDKVLDGDTPGTGLRASPKSHPHLVSGLC